MPGRRRPRKKKSVPFRYSRSINLPKYRNSKIIKQCMP